MVFPQLKRNSKIIDKSISDKYCSVSLINVCFKVIFDPTDLKIDWIESASRPSHQFAFLFQKFYIHV